MADTRTITKRQFADGCTVDGDKLDSASSDVVERINEIPRGDFKRRFVQTQFVSGFLPRIAGGAPGDRSLPFMKNKNETTQVAAGSTAPDSFNAEYRVKGVWTPDNVAGVAEGEVDKWVWSYALAFSGPAILIDVTCFMTTDSVFSNTFQYGSPAPVGNNSGDPVDDIDLVVHVDSVFNPEDRRRNTKEVARHEFKASAENFSRAAVGVGFTDMAPTHPDSGLDGMCIVARDLNVPIHRGSRVRVALCLPQYSTLVTPWGTNPTERQYYSMTATFLEEIEEI